MSITLCTVCWDLTSTFILPCWLWSVYVSFCVHAHLLPWFKKSEIFDAAYLFFSFHLNLFRRWCLIKCLCWACVCVNICMCDFSQSRFTVASLFIALKYVVFCWVVWLGYVTALSTVAINNVTAQRTRQWHRPRSNTTSSHKCTDFSLFFFCFLMTQVSSRKCSPD